LRFGSGITVGLLGGAIGNHWSLFVACAGFAVFLAVLQVRLGRRAA
jgi:hypothetical protein